MKTISKNYDFPVEWYDGQIRDAQQELRDFERITNAFKTKSGRYYEAHVLIVQMRKVALAAMLTIPRPPPAPKPPAEHA